MLFDHNNLKLFYVAIICLLFIFLFLFFCISSKKIRINGKDKKYESKKYLLTQRENAFMERLEQYIPDNMEIHCQVRLADIIKVSKNVHSKNFYSNFNKISAKSIDFVICDKKTRKIRGCVELDDPTHSEKDRVQRDIFVNDAMEQSNIPILRAGFKKSINEISSSDIENFFKTL